MNKNAYKKLYNQEQAGLIYNLFCPRKNIEEICKKCEDKPCQKWINKNARKFKEVLEKTYLEELSQNPYKVYKNPEKNISELIKKDLKKQVKNHNPKVMY